MGKYCVFVSWIGGEHVYVDAMDEEEAKQKALKEASYLAADFTDGAEVTDISLEEVA